MQKANIHLFSGPIQTGKTTRLTKWIDNKDNVAGILQPVINGKRHIKNISTGEIRLLESQDKTDETVIIGNYRFNPDVFKWAQKELLNSYYKFPDWLIIDEVGKLELKGEGLEPVVTRILTDENEKKINILLVIRDYLLKQFLEKFSLKKDDIHILDLQDNNHNNIF
jgi:nucleoside-triphosphatase THEP1